MVGVPVKVNETLYNEAREKFVSMGHRNITEYINSLIRDGLLADREYLNNTMTEFVLRKRMEDRGVL